MVGVEVLPVGTGIVQPVLTEQVCEMQRHGGASVGRFSNPRGWPARCAPFSR
jgi:hypothetical protein